MVDAIIMRIHTIYLTSSIKCIYHWFNEMWDGKNYKNKLQKKALIPVAIFQQLKHNKNCQRPASLIFPQSIRW